jgi:hypothetical protein
MCEQARVATRGQEQVQRSEGQERSVMVADDAQRFCGVGLLL